jgi:hypothetical protein
MSLTYDGYGYLFPEADRMAAAHRRRRLALPS